MAIQEAAPPAGSSESRTSSSERYHALDFVRGALMLLGLVYHAAIPYDNIYQAAVKPYPTSEYLGWFTEISHAFRMPLFFVLAGFFAALLLSRRSKAQFALNRGVRIGVPLIVGWIVLGPLCAAGIYFSILSHVFTQQFALNFAWGMLKRLDHFMQDDLMHLWFLYYLLIFYAGFLVLSYVAGRVPLARFEGLHARVVGILGTHWRVLLLAVPTFFLLYLGPAGGDSTPFSFVPDRRFGVYYAVLFGVGVLLYSARETIRDFGHSAWLYIFGSAVMMAVFVYTEAQMRETPGTERGWEALGFVAVAFMMWGVFFGTTSLLLRHLNRPIGPVRYLADASYWAYLLHPLPMFWIPGLMARQPWAPEVKFLLVLVPVTVLCFVTYDLLVRWTYIGTVLQGRRYPSAFASLLRRLRTGSSLKPLPETSSVAN
jgi:glucan biosynthesis protein C